jgi:hypothetical protein
MENISKEGRGHENTGLAVFFAALSGNFYGKYLKT